ncbi:uncharacterized protein LOC112165601 [Rosa chinensis]|uniref:uncharacterized protein LOC112165601 n=1 Tax=Rosa chinensis TaxID=74649 RepID=UPI000D087144|nr:uncharacterized protein LOC112165601 [Rosa chinensis]
MGYSIWEIAKAFIDDHSKLTADLYTQAITVDPNNSELYSDRAQANIKSNNLTVLDSNIGAVDLGLKARMSKLGLRRFLVLDSNIGAMDLGLKAKMSKLGLRRFLGKQVQTLTNRKEKFRKFLESYKPSLVYLQGEQLENDEVGSFAWRDADLPTAESISDIFPHCLQL